MIIPLLAIARRYWPAILGGLAVLALVASLMITRHSLATRTVQRDEARAAYVKLAADVRAQTAAALAADRVHAATVQANDTRIAQEVNHDLETKLVAARRDASAYAARMRVGAPADRGGGNVSRVSAATDTAGPVVGADQAAELDATACATGVTIAQGWQDWWMRVSAAER